MTLDSNTSNTSSLAGWLEGIGLGHYRERLQQNGYTIVNSLKEYFDSNMKQELKKEQIDLLPYNLDLTICYDDI